MNDLTIREVSTTHITEQDGALLRDSSTLGVSMVAPDQSESLLLLTYERLDEFIIPSGFSPEFQRIYKDALEAGVSYLLFTPDVAPVAEYPQFEW